METKSLYRIGPLGGLQKEGECPVNCDEATVLGYEPTGRDNLVWGHGKTEQQRKTDARDNAAMKDLQSLL